VLRQLDLLRFGESAAIACTCCLIRLFQMEKELPLTSADFDRVLVRVVALVTTLEMSQFLLENILLLLRVAVTGMDDICERADIMRKLIPWLTLQLGGDPTNHADQNNNNSTKSRRISGKSSNLQEHSSSSSGAEKVDVRSLLTLVTPMQEGSLTRMRKYILGGMINRHAGLVSLATMKEEQGGGLSNTDTENSAAHKGQWDDTDMGASMEHSSSADAVDQPLPIALKDAQVTENAPNPNANVHQWVEDVYRSILERT